MLSICLHSGDFFCGQQGPFHLVKVCLQFLHLLLLVKQLLDAKLPLSLGREE